MPTSGPITAPYGFAVTVDGLDLIATLLIPEQLRITRVMVGSGRAAPGADLANFTDLIAPIAQATSTVPSVKDRVVQFAIEYRNDMNGGLPTGFWLNEYGVFAIHPTKGEILLYYGTLGNYPEWMFAFGPGMLNVRRYPVSIGFTNDVEVVIEYPTVAFMTADDVDNYFRKVALPIVWNTVELSARSIPKVNTRTHHVIIAAVPDYIPFAPPPQLTNVHGAFDVTGHGIKPGALQLDDGTIKPLALQVYK